MDSKAFGKELQEIESPSYFCNICNYGSTPKKGIKP